MSRTGVTSFDRSDEQGARVAARLENDIVGWMTTVAADGTPQTSPVWFIWDGEEFLVYSLASARARNLAGQARVSFHLDGNGQGGDIVVVEGTGRIEDSEPPVTGNPAYLAKYKRRMDDKGWTPEWFAERYSVPIRITPTKYRYW